jgi:hypothetical protein
MDPEAVNEIDKHESFLYTRPRTLLCSLEPRVKSPDPNGSELILTPPDLDPRSQYGSGKN